MFDQIHEVNVCNRKLRLGKITAGQDSRQKMELTTWLSTPCEVEMVRLRINPALWSDFSGSGGEKNQVC